MNTDNKNRLYEMIHNAQNFAASLEGGTFGISIGNAIYTAYVDMTANGIWTIDVEISEQLAGVEKKVIKILSIDRSSYTSVRDGVEEIVDILYTNDMVNR